MGEQFFQNNDDCASSGERGVKLPCLDLSLARVLPISYHILL